MTGHPAAENEVKMVGALLLGLVAGVVARALMPGDVFRRMSGPASGGLQLGDLRQMAVAFADFQGAASGLLDFEDLQEAATAPTSQIPQPP